MKALLICSTIATASTLPFERIIPKNLQQRPNTSRQQRRQLYDFNPVYSGGWVPRDYPDPLTQTDLCHIDEVTTSYNQVNGTPLLLCDPDGIWTSYGIQNLAAMLQNFTESYSSPTSYIIEEINSTDPDIPVTNVNGRRKRWLRRKYDVVPEESILKSYNNEVIYPTKGSRENDQIRLGYNYRFRNSKDNHGYSRFRNRKLALKRNKKRVLRDSQHTMSVLNNILQWNHDSNLKPQIAVAAVSRMNLPEILHNFAFYTFEDEEDMINDAAQYFSSYLYGQWFSGNRMCNSTTLHANAETETKCRPMSREDILREENGILIFISTLDRVCFITSGSNIIQILPWWRLERVVASMREEMRECENYEAVMTAVANISNLLDEGPPTFQEKLLDFLGRFGIVIFFFMSSVFLAVCGEYRERNRRLNDAMTMSALDDIDKEKANMLQQDFKTETCPICLEDFPPCKSRRSLNKDYCIPTHGSDGQEIKMLRCGHILDQTCWKTWIRSRGCLDPSICPVCRASIGKPRRRRQESESSQESNGLMAYGTFGSGLDLEESSPLIVDNEPNQGSEEVVSLTERDT